MANWCHRVESGEGHGRALNSASPSESAAALIRSPVGGSGLHVLESLRRAAAFPLLFIVDAGNYRHHVARKSHARPDDDGR